MRALLLIAGLSAASAAIAGTLFAGILHGLFANLHTVLASVNK